MIALIIAHNTHDAGLNNSVKIFACLLIGGLTGLMVAGTYGFLVFPFAPRTSSYLLNSFVRLIGQGCLMLICWAILSLFGLGINTFIAHHVWACIWSTITGAGLFLLLIWGISMA